VSRIVASFVLFGSLWALGLIPTTAAEMYPLVGTWTLNVAKSQSDSGPLPKGETRVYAVNPLGALTLIAEGTDAEGTLFAYGATGDINGREYPIPGRDVGARILGDTIVWKRIDPNTVEMTITKKGEVINTTRHAVSEDRKTLTIAENGVDDEGRAIHQTRIYDRQ
jgi:hypothetical protein